MSIKDLASKKEIAKLYYLYEEDLNEYMQKDNKLLKEQLQREERLNYALTEEQQEEYTKIEDLRAQNITEEEKRVFIYAFSLGVRLALESIDKI